MRADGRHPLTPLSRHDRRCRGVAAERRSGRDRGGERRSRLGREPEPRRGRRAALLPERRGAAGGARVRIPHGQPRTCRGCVRGGGGGGRAGVRRARRRGRGRGSGEADDRAARATRTRARRDAPRAELHGLLRPRRRGGVERPSAGHDRPGTRRGPVPVGLDRRRVPLAGRANRSAVRRLLGSGGRHGRCRLPRLLRRGSGNACRGSVPGDGEATRRVRRRATAVRRGRQARRVPQGRPLGSGGASCAVAHRCARRLGPGVLRGAPALLRGRGRRLPRARRDARDPRP